MIFKYFLLALSASLDALILGITYGIKKTKMSKTGNAIIFAIVFVCSTFALLIGHFLSLLLSPTFSVLFGSFLLMMLGLYNIYKGIKKSNEFINFDVDNSNYIDNKEATSLGLAVAIDASCVSISAGIIGYISFILPFFMAIFHTLFVISGNLVAKSIVERLNVPSNLLSIFSGVLLVLISVFRIFI